MPFSGRQPIGEPGERDDRGAQRRREQVGDRRPTSTAGRHIGSVRNRSITPLFRSVLRPTAVPMDEVVRFSASSPAIAKSA